MGQLSPIRQAYLAIEKLEAKVASLEQARHAPVAVVGMGLRFPGDANTPAQFWNLLLDGVDAITDTPADRWDMDAYYHPDADMPGKIASRWGGYLRNVDQFDPAFFGIAPREAISMDPQQRLLLEVTWEALESAGLSADRLYNSRTGVFVGVASGDYNHVLLENLGLKGIDAYYASGIAHSVVGGRISYLLGLRGPAVTLDTACSSSLVSVHLAVQSLRSGESDLTLAGGVNLILSPENGVALSRYHMMSPEGRCKPFDAAADGFVRAEGCGVVVLKRLSDALADGDPILAVIRGSAVNQDGASTGLTAPNGPSQEDVIRAALADAGAEPREIGYVETHGTGTALGDPIEAQALGASLGPGRSADQPLLIGSVKSNLGHMEASAGVGGLIKAILVLQHQTIPPHLHLNELSPHIPWERLPLVIPTETTPFDGVDGRRLVGVSAFGFSGTNCHMILEEAPVVETAANSVDRTHHLLTVSAKSGAALKQRVNDLATSLQTHPEVALSDVAYTTNAGRAHFNYRLALNAATSQDAVDKLMAYAEGRDIPGLAEGVLPTTDRPRIAFLFTGQGAQYAGMGRTLYETQPTFRAAMDACDEILRPLLPQPLLSVIYPQDGDDTELINHTTYTQPALFAIEYSLAKLWQSWGIQPHAVLGHSVGEYAAACIAGVFSLEDGLRLIAERGRLMGALPAGGAMAAAFADEQTVAEIIDSFGDTVTIATLNGPENTVISGAGEAVDDAVDALKAQGIKVRRLNVSHAFHSSLMEPMLPEFEQVLNEVHFSRPRMRMATNITGTFATDELSHGDYWLRQARGAVRFADDIQTLYDAGYRVFLEVGPNPTLIGMAQRIVPDGTWLTSLRANKDDWETLLNAAGSLYTVGAEPDWVAFDADYTRRKVDLPTYPFQHQRYWVKEKPYQARKAGKSAGDFGLLGEKLASPLKTIQFETVLTPEDFSFLNDHRIHGTPILPATAYMEMALEAANVLLGGGQIENLGIYDALAVPDDQARVVQMVLQPRSGNRHQFELFSQGEGEADWKLHASGDIVAGFAEPATTETPDAIQARCDSESDAETHYARLYQSGLNFGPGLHGVQHLWHGDGEALGLIDVPEAIASEIEQYIIHPSLLDACLQVLAEAVPADVAQTDVYLPVGIGALAVHTGLTPPMFSHARVQYGASQDVLQGELTVIDEAGNVLLSLTNIRLKRASKAVLGRMGQADITNWLYQPTWQPTPLPQPLQLPSPATVQEIVQPFVVPYKDKYGQSAYDDLSPQIDSLSADYVLLALQDLGWQPAAGERFDLQTLANQLGVLAQHARLFERLFGMLEADGYIQHQGSTWTVTAAIPQQDAAALDQRATDLLETYPAFSAELTFAQRCGSHLAGALNGTVDPLQLLFPDGSFALTDNLYQKSPGARTYNALVQQAVQTLLAEVPEDRKVRILEIGAGTGGTTSFVVPDLPADRVESYTFTDISPLFGSRAAERFKAYPFMEYGVLDIEKDPLEQGFEPGQADLIIAANVIHATADLRTTLTHVRKLLAPNGTLILLEMIRPERWVDLSFGLTDGWWRFVDRDIRNDYLLMPQEGWFNVLSQCGFVEWGSIPAAGGPLPEDAVIIARAGVSENWLIFADQSGLGADLASALSSEGHHCALVEAGDAYERTSDGYMIDPSVPAHFQQLVSENPWSQVIYLWGLDAALPEDADKATLDAVQRQITGSALLLSQALLSAPARLWLVTRGAQAVDEPTFEVSQSTLWGLGKAISLEHPELQPIRLDLDPEGFALEQLVALLLSPDAEDQLALRDSTRYVARLERYQPTETIDDDQPVQLTIQERGVIDNLLLTPLTRRQPGPGEVEVRVRATGLNFKDVLNVMGMYPGDAGALGGECAGEVTAVGPDVTDLQVGDAVLGMTSGAFSSYVIADAKLMVRKPVNISFEQAATLPIPFITAYYALHYLGDMQVGEKVLIHAATGGVGFAAVQLAQRVGAEIYATAGTDEKRDLLHSLGVPHVMNSRTLEFAETMQALTNGNGVDLVLNSLADEFVPASVSTLAADGRFLEIGKRGILTEAEFAQARPDADYHIIDWTPEAVHNPQLIRSILLEIMAWMEEGSLHPLPVRTFPLAEASAAFRFMAQARHIGKIAITQQVPGEIRPDATYLITGGLRGLGLLVAEWLAEKGARHLVLMGRQAPSEQAQETLDALAATGVQVLVARGDVSQEADVRRVMDEIEASMPPLRGVIHSAGALADAGLMAQDWAHFETVFASKVDGAWLLHQFTQALPLDFFVLFSSVASLIGSRGQANHVAGNSFMDALVHYRRSLGLPGMSINWGAWGEIGAVVEHGVGERVAQQGVGLIAPSEGLEVLDLLLKNAPVQVGVSPIDWPVLLRNFTAPFFSAFAGEETDAASATAAEAQAMPQAVGIRQQLVEITPANRHSMLTEFVREQVAYVLGAPSAQVVDERTPMNSLGLDSLMAVELRNRLTTGLQLERPLPATLVFDYPTVLAITDFLLEMLVPASEVDDRAAPETPEPTEAAGDQVLDLLDAFETLSDEEVDRLLAQHMGQNNEEDYGDE